MRTFLKTVFVFICLLSSLFVEAKVNPDSLQKCIDNPALSDSQRVVCMVNLSLYYKDNDLPHALQLSSKAMETAIALGMPLLIADTKDNHATILKFKGDYPAAEQLYHESIATYEESGDSLYLPTVYGHLGTLYQAMEQNQLAILFLLRSLKMEQKLKGRENGIAATLNNIGNVYYTDKNYLKALGFYKNALAINRANGFRKWEAINYLNIGNTFKDLKNIDSASWYYRSSIRMAEELKIIWVLAAAHEGLGSCLLRQGKPQEAKQEFYIGLEYAQQFGNMELALYLRAGLAEAQKDLGELDSARATWQACVDSAKAYNFPFLSAQLYMLGAEIFEVSGDFKAANQLYKTYSEMKDSLVVVQNDAMYRSFETRLREEEHEHERELMRKNQQERSQQENRRNKMALLFTAVVLLLSIGLGLFAFRSYRLKKRSHEDLSVQKDIIEEKNKEILSSIAYAQRLQEAILPSQETWIRSFPSSFIFYLPKDIVAGDFYWMENKGGMQMFAVADCTGHGVPGALVSVVCSNALNRAVREFGLTSPGEILDKVAGLVVETFANGEQEVHDGMDITFCCYDSAKKQLQWAGANLPIWLIQTTSAGTQLTEIKPDKQPIGKFDLRRPFTTHTCTVQEGDLLFLFSDGYADQFGGPKGKKFKYKQLQQILINNHSLPMSEQRQNLETALHTWRGNLEQVDDICVIGIKL